MTNTAVAPDTLKTIRTHQLAKGNSVTFHYRNRAGERVKIHGTVTKLLNGTAGPMVRIALMEYIPGTMTRKEVNYLIANIETPDTTQPRASRQATSCANGCDARGTVNRADESGTSALVCRACAHLPRYLLSY